MNLSTNLRSMFQYKTLSMYAFCLISTCVLGQLCPIDPLPNNQADLEQCSPSLQTCGNLNIGLNSFVLEAISDCDSCDPGDNVSVNLVLNLTNNSEQISYLSIFSDINDAVNSCRLISCLGPIAAMSTTENGDGKQSFVLQTVNYRCGENLTIENLFLVQGRDNNQCPLGCNDASPNCGVSLGDFTITSPTFSGDCSDPIMRICDDGNPCTINDTEAIDACDGVSVCVPCTGDAVAACVVTSTQACDDGDPCTENDVVTFDACSGSVCIPCQGTLASGQNCDPQCEVFNASNCSCDPKPALDCEDYDCTTFDSYDSAICNCVHEVLPEPNCDDGYCYTTDSYDAINCKCVHDSVSDTDCDDGDCTTFDQYNYNWCACEHIPICDNVNNGGWIGYDQGNCAPFDPNPIYSVEEPEGGCGDIEYMWLKSSINVPYYSEDPNTPWTIIPSENEPIYDPEYMMEGVMCFLRCSRTNTCSDFIGESNVVCITVGGIQECNDWDCTTEDNFNYSTCECEYTQISNPSCDDGNCSTIGEFNPSTCECEFISICNNLTYAGAISGNQESCGPFDPEKITSLFDPSGGCGDIEYMWLMSTVYLDGTASPGSPWIIIPDSNEECYDPGFLSETTYFRRCARSEGCEDFNAESNIICIEVGISEECDDGNCNTQDTFDPETCDCIHVPINISCDDNDCATEDIYNPVTCTCSYSPIEIPDCDDNDCNTEDKYIEETCSCEHIILPSPNCDDGDCSTFDTYDAENCICVNTEINPPVCNDFNCGTIDSYDEQNCLCIHTPIQLPDCDDNDCNTIDQYNPRTCICEHTPIAETNCDDGNCNTTDSYNINTCECEFVPIATPVCDDDNCQTIDIYNPANCECVFTAIPIPDCDDNDCNTVDIYNRLTCECTHRQILQPDCDDNDCNTIDSYDSLNCRCINTTIPVPDCDDGNCRTDDIYNTQLCRCINTFSPDPDCDDNDCNTLDTFNVETCQCENTPIPQPNCDDNDCSTVDTYDEATCQCDFTTEMESPECSLSDITLELNGNGNAVATLNDLNIQTSDNCDDDLTVTPTGFTFSCDNVGSNLVTVTVTDDSGNSSVCSATVTIVDNIIPECSVEDITIFVSEETVSISDSQFDVSVVDNCSASAVGMRPMELNCEDAGSVLEYMFLVTDDSGNTSICAANVSVETDVDLECSFVASIDACLDVDGQFFVTPDMVVLDGNAGTCNGNIVYDISPVFFACNDQGIQEVKVTATDDLGNVCCEVIEVDVQDKILPSFLDCPSDITITCSEDISNLNIYGSVTALTVTDNCAGSVTIDQTPPLFNIDECNIGSIVREWILTDLTGNQNTCNQTITIVNSNPFTEDNINWPPANESADCSSNGSGSEPVLGTEPTLVNMNNLDCSEVEISSVDTGGDGCNSITRVWTVRDMCQRGNSGVFTFTQNLAINDNQAPEIIGSGPRIMNLDDDECTMFVDFDLEISDNCTASGNLDINTTDFPGDPISVTNNGDGTFTFTGIFCAGRNVFDVVVTDECGNTSTEEVTVVLNGGTCYDLTCRKVNLVFEQDGTATAVANNLLSLNNEILCSYADVQGSFSPNQIVSEMQLTCADLLDPNNPLQDGNIGIPLYIFINGMLFEQVECATINIPVIVFPNFSGICEEMFGGRISGSITTINNEPIPDVEVSVKGANLAAVMTDANGAYSFPAMPLSGDYTIVPMKDINPLNGVSTLDILNIGQHILSFDPFTSPYQYIAADVDRSGRVTALDMVEMRKLILGIYDELPENTSWRMIDADYEFSQSEDPFNAPIPEEYDIYELESEMIINFIGVKVGDVNQSATTNLNSNKVESRTAEMHNIFYNDFYMESGMSYKLILENDSADKLQGFQFALDLDREAIHIEEILLSEESLLAPANISERNMNSGLIYVSWDKLSANKESDQIVEIKISANVSGYISEYISFSEEYMIAEAYQTEGISDISLIPIKGENQVSILTVKTRPNPWSEQVEMTISSGKDENANIRFYNLDGKLLKQDILTLSKGSNIYSLNNTDFNEKGVIIFELITEKDKLNGKMILLN